MVAQNKKNKTKSSINKKNSSAHAHTLLCKPKTVNGKLVYSCTPYLRTVKKTTTKSASVKNSSKLKHDDGYFLLRLALLALVGLLWIKISLRSGLQLPLPIGFLVGIFIAIRGKREIDRKIQFVVLLMALLVGFIAPLGIYVEF